jgi:aspartyl-tRNA(Asn)/glutamyl-tRNA(Gln) amidotransferase subunit C
MKTHRILALAGMTLQERCMITEQDVKKVAHLARLHVTEQEVQQHAKTLSNILEMIAHINKQDTQSISPMFSPLDTTLQMRDDAIMEENQRERLQKLAPHVESGLYLVPKVIE